MELAEIVEFFKGLQDNICASLEALDGKVEFHEDPWDRPEGGGGRSRIIENGKAFEKGGVNFSHVHGPLPEVLKSETRNASSFHATGVSIVIHPQNPLVPVIHMNVRYFEMPPEEGFEGDCWFGGGIDLSPAYLSNEHAQFFHSSLKAACDKSDMAYYPKFKKWCDNYFYIKHRKEMRGIGGIFFDHLKPDDKKSKADLFQFVKDVGESFVPIYQKLVEENISKSYSQKEKDWQYIRRGRYTEFNLVYDRGTHFGLKTNGRIESILMSLPPVANWKYNHHPEPESEEARMLEMFQPQDWAK